MPDPVAPHPRPKRVFISYSREPDENQHRVRLLADTLRLHGIEAVIDDYEAAPEETWQAWMKRQINESDFVLLVCTKSYLERSQGNDPDGGRGVSYEAKLISDAIYEAKQKNSRYIPVVFSKEESRFILQDVTGWSFYTLGNDPYDPLTSGGYQDLYRRITEQPRFIPPKPGAIIVLPPESPAAAPRRDTVPEQTDHVLIAESPPERDIANAISDFTNALTESGYASVVPDDFYSDRDFREEYVQRLTGAKAFLQVIGTHRFPPTDLFPEGYERWQLQQAERLGIPVLRWRSPAVDPGSITDAARRDFVTRDVVSSIPEEFKRHMRDWLRALKAKSDRPVEQEFRLLLVNHHQSDADIAELFGRESQQIAEWLQACVCDDQRPLAEAVGMDPVAAFVVVYAKADEEWVLKQLDACWKISRDIALKLKRKPPQRAVYVVKTDDKKPLRRRPVDCKLLEGGQIEQLKAFLAGLAQNGDV